MRPQVITQTGIGSTAWIPLDYKQSPFNVGFGVTVTGTVNYTIEHTFDDVYDLTITPIAFSHSTVTAQSTNQDGNYAFPIRAVRVTVNSGTGSAKLTLLQGLR